MPTNKTFSSVCSVPTLRRTLGVTAAASALLLAACATKTPPVELSSARVTVNRAATNPAVVKNAPVELKAATDAMAQADAQWANKKDAEEARHLAYVATQKAAAAEQMALSRTATAEIQQGKETATQLQLQARTQEADAAKAKLAELQAQQTERGLVVTFGDVLFQTGQATLLPQAAAQIDRLAEFLVAHPERKLLVEGHTDSVGSHASNQTLSQNRAHAVQSALVAKGVAASRIVARGFGETYPVASNANAEGRAMNRRVEVIVADDKGVLRSR